MSVKQLAEVVGVLPFHPHEKHCPEEAWESTLLMMCLSRLFSDQLDAREANEEGIRSMVDGELWIANSIYEAFSN